MLYNGENAEGVIKVSPFFFFGLNILSISDFVQICKVFWWQFLTSSLQPVVLMAAVHFWKYI